MRVSGKQQQTEQANRTGEAASRRPAESMLAGEFAEEWMGDGGRIERMVLQAKLRP